MLFRCFIFLIAFLSACPVKSQNVSIEIATDPNIQFNFTTIDQLANGIVIPNAITVNIISDSSKWDLYAGAVTTVAGTWENVQYYSASGTSNVPVNILSMRAHNLSNTPLTSGYVIMQDIATSTMDIIGNHMLTDPSVNCSDLNHTGTNMPGSYLTDPQCYQFRIDLKATPGINYRPGVYTMQIVFIIAEDL
jgi:hypothetical protein